MHGNTGMKQEGCVSVTAINGLIMYLAVLAVVKRVRGGAEGGGEGVDSVSRLVKSKLGEEREALFVGLNAVNNIRECS